MPPRLIPDWLIRRWYEFRLAHAAYSAYLLAGVNSLLIVHRLLIERIEALSFIGLAEFSLVAVVVYLAYNIALGHYHRKRMLPIEQAITWEASPLAMELINRMRVINTQLEQIQAMMREKGQGDKGG